MGDAKDKVTILEAMASSINSGWVIIIIISDFYMLGDANSDIKRKLVFECDLFFSL